MAQAVADIQANQADIQGSLATIRLSNQVLLNGMSSFFTIQGNGMASIAGDRASNWMKEVNGEIALIQGVQAYNKNHWVFGMSLTDVWNLKVAFETGAAQGVVNAVNGLQDAVIDLANLAVKVSPVGAIANGLGYDLTIPSPDWSKGLIVNESDSAHWWSKFLGGQALLILATDGASLVGEAGPAVQAAEATSETQSLFRLGGKTYKFIYEGDATAEANVFRQIQRLTTLYLKNGGKPIKYLTETAEELGYAGKVNANIKRIELAPNGFLPTFP